MQQSRILTLRQADHSGKAVIYVMSRDQRTRDNHALLAAQSDALNRHVPLVVLFNLYTRTGVRSREHYQFMIDGLRQVAAGLSKKNIAWSIRSGNAHTNILDLIKETDAASVYFDFSPLHGPRALAKSVSVSFNGSSFVVDTHNVIPVWVASDKQEFAAHTLRRKIHLHLHNYLSEPDPIVEHPYSFTEQPSTESFADIINQLDRIPASGINLSFESGEQSARAHLKAFIADGLQDYALKRNDAAHDFQSNLSPYLHYGQLSSLRVALEVTGAIDDPPLLLNQARMAQAGTTTSKTDGMNALLEEMLVRKELSDNFCFYSPSYTTFKGVPEWGRKTLNDHRADPRDFQYTRDEWEAATTHDDAWNAAQKQMMKAGKMHNYMRMYWAKKILEWSASPEDALATAIYLNDKYTVDGGDPNGYVGILWSLSGLHDRPWTERSVFGSVRYMNAAGLKRKFDIAAYINDWI